MKKYTLIFTALFLILLLPMAAMADTSGEKLEQLTYEEALNKAYAFSITLKNAAANIEQAVETRNKSNDNLRFVPADGSNSAAASAWKSALQNQLRVPMLEKEYKIAKEKLAYTVKSAYYDVIKALESQKVAVMALEIENRKYKTNNIKAQLGMISKYDLDDSLTALREKEKSKLSADQSLITAYEKLNAMIGLPASVRYKLVDYPKFESFEIDEQGLEAQILRVTTSSDTVWLAEQNLELAEIDLKMSAYSDATTYRNNQLNLEKSMNSLQQTKDSLEQTTRNMYNKLKLLEYQHQTLSGNYNKLEQSLEKMKLNHALGLVATNDLLDFELSLAQQKNSFLDLAIQQDLAKMSYYAPWI